MPLDVKAAYSLDDIDTLDAPAVAETITHLHRQHFPDSPSGYIRQVILDMERMFNGYYPGYQAMDTAYHDIEHTFQASLCWVRMMLNRHAVKAEPLMDGRDFHIGLVAILLHDIGYLKHKYDRAGTGAKFTFVHERRSCELAQLYLEEHGWPQREIFSVQHLISCTGPRAIIDSIPFFDRKEKLLGQSVCTADYIGQMSDPSYVGKLPVLYEEFEESDDFRQIPAEDRLFHSFIEMLEGTPRFWEYVKREKLEKDCAGLFHYLASPYPDGPNPYVERIDQNIDRIRHMTQEEKESLAATIRYNSEMRTLL